MAISSIGVGSGLPLDQLLSDIRKSENQPLVLLQQKQVLSEARLSGYGILKGALTDLQKTAAALNKPELYGAHQATSSHDAISVTADSKAVAGNYQINVKNLATQQMLVANGRADRDVAIGAGGDLTVTLANGESHTIELGADTSLQGVMKSINANPDLGMQATIINDGNNDAPSFRLMLTATDTGSQASISAMRFSDSELHDAFGIDALPAPEINPDTGAIEDSFNHAGYLVTNAQNAKLTINGIAVESQSNQVEGNIEGLKLDLKSMPTNGETVRINVTRDDKPAIDAVKELVNSYNSLLDTIKKQTSFDVENGTSSALTGEYLVRNIESKMRGALSSADPSGAIGSLADLGIKTDYKTGKLEIDDETLSKAVKENLADVTTFLSGENGLGKKVDAAANEFIKSGGLIQNTTDSLNKNIKMLQDQYQAVSDRIDSKMENYRKQFSQLDVMVNQMNGISNYLSQQLSMLANMNSSNK